MAITATEIQALYVAYFNRPADVLGLQFWVNRANASADGLAKVANEFSNSDEYRSLYANKQPAEIVDAIYMNLFGRHAEAEGLVYWANKLINKELNIGNVALIISQSAQNEDQVAITAKVSAAEQFTASLTDASEILGYSGDAANAIAKTWLAGIKDDATLAAATTEAALQAVSDSAVAAHDNATNVPTTTVLTKGLDNVNGGAGSDLIIGAIDSGVGGNAELNTLSGIDNINGGAGIDTLKIAHNSGNIVLGNVSNVEIVTIESAIAVTVDASNVAGVTNLNVAKAGGAIIATAAATTSVDVSLKDGGSVTVNGGKDVNVALTDNVSNIDVGATGADAAGAVTITTTGKAAANNTNTTLGNIAVGGGKTVTVTQHATSNAGAIVADGTTETVTQGNVAVTAGATTTDVTITQDAAVTAASRAAVAGATEVASVKFTALATGESVTVGGLVFTAAKDLTAAQVAQAFANLSSASALPTQIAGPGPLTATSDTNGSSVAANGIFSGTLLANWNTAAASDDTVVFTGKANTAMTDLVATAKATVTTTTQGVTAVSAKNTLGINAGTVTIDGGVALKTVTVDGFATSTGAAGINGATNTALDTIKLSNGGSFSIDSAAATLGLTLNNIDGTVTVAAGTKTLNAQVDGADVDTTLASASAETINVTGAGNVVGDTGTGLTAAKAISTTGATGTATFTIANGTVTSYTGGAAVDTVTVSNAGTAITKAIDLGAGNDTLNLSGTVVVPTAALNGGDGVDTIGLNGASAAALSANGDFAGKISGFEKLAITDNVATPTTVNMANMDGITYVVSNNSAATAGASVKEVFTVDLSTSTAVGADTIAFNGATINVAAGDTPAQIAQKLAAASYTDWVVTGLNGSVVTFEAKVAGATGDVLAANFTITDVDATTAAVVAAAPSTQGTVTYTLDLTGVALFDTDTIAIGGTTVYTVPAAAGLQNTAAVKAAVVAAGTVTIGGVVYTITSGTGNNIVLTTSNVAPAATLTFLATDTGSDNNGFAAGTPAVVAKVNGAAEVFAADFATSAAIEDGDTIAFNGTTITLASGDTPAQIAAKVAAGTYTNWTASVAGTVVTFTNKATGVATDVVTGDFAITNVTSATSIAKVVVTTTTQGVTSGAATGPGLTIDKLANAGTVELVAAGAGVIVKMADATGSADSFNLVTKVVAGDLAFGTVDVAGVETIKFSAIDSDTSTTTGGGVNTASLTLKADKATALTIDGSSNVTLTLDATTTKLATIDASALTGKLAASANGAVAMTITGGAGADTLHASVGTDAKADVINGGAGKDIIYAGTNGAKLTGGDGNDLFILTAASAAAGNKESNTYSEITDFQAGDVLQLQAFSGAAAADVSSFGKLAATLNENTAVFSDFVNAAIKQADAGAAVWFNYKGDAYVVVDSDASTDAFVNGQDLIVKLTGINGDSLSFNSDFGTAALV